ncbi:MAG TPA: PIN domain-containing protein [Terrimicrobiaceae bacterium]
MIHLDANLLIAASDPEHPHVPVFRSLLAEAQPLAASSIAWTEYRSYPIDPLKERVLLQVLEGGVVPFDRISAELAGQLFHKTKTHRRNRLDSMIAATAILKGAHLATANRADFEPFVPLGLKLHPLSPP